MVSVVKISGEIKRVREITHQALLVKYQGRLGVSGLGGVHLFDGGFLGVDGNYADAMVEVMPEGFQITIEQGRLDF